MNNKGSNQRTSLYLVRRADALLGALRFFAGDIWQATARRLQFLAQSDFWEWEIDNLIYSFVNLAERQATWGSERATAEKLGQLGIAVDAKLLRRAAWRGESHGHWEMRKSDQRVAPVELLREVIDLWNHLIDRVEQQFVTPMQTKATRWNIQTVKNLGHLRKKMPAFTGEEAP